jgi:adenylosuccinate lyase
MREGQDNNLLDALADDPRIPLDRQELKALISDPIEFTGAAQEQVSRVVKRIEAITTKHSDAAKYQPGSIR